MIEQAVILVGGLGTRLRQAGLNCPKPLAQVGGRPFLDYVLMSLARFGVRRFLLVAGYRGEQVVDLYDGVNRFGASVSVIVEPEPMGTGGALAFARDHLDDQFIVSNGDSLFWTDFAALVAQDLPPGVDGRMQLREIDDSSRYGTVTLNATGRIETFREKIAGLGKAVINAGVYVLKKSAVLDVIRTLPCSLEKNVFELWAAERRLEGVLGSGFFIDIGLPETLASASATVLSTLTRPAALLDRDGVINVDTGYTHKVEDLVFTPTAVAAIKRLNAAGVYVFVISNQAGVARGLYGEQEIKVFHDAMQQMLLFSGAHIDSFYYSPFHPQGVIQKYSIEHHTRKPNPGMILQAFSDWPIQKSESFLIGDKQSDLNAAEAAGVPAHMFVANIGDLLALVDRILRH